MEQVLKIKKTKKQFLEFLSSIKETYGAKSIEATFSGGDDSGELDDSFTLSDKNEKIINKPLTKDEISTLYAFFEAYLENTEYNWYDNDGGFGSITLNLETGDISCEMNINKTSYETYDLEDSEFAKKYSF